MNVHIFYRKKSNDRYSIEKVYNTLLPYFKKNTTSVFEMPFKSQGLFKRLFNIIFATFNQSTVNHITGDIHYVNFFISRKKTLLTIHDIYPILRTTGIRRSVLKLFWFDIPIKKSHTIITVSHFSKKEITRCFNVNPNKTHVIYNCISPCFSYQKHTFNKTAPTILHIGTKPNKNLPRLIEALKGISCQLIIIGKPTPTLTEQLNKNAINFTFKTSLNNAEVMAAYKNCDILSFTSTYEGFGLPIIEAQAMGRVVVTSNIASMPEVAGNGALLVNPYEIESIKNGILQVITDSTLRENLIQKGLENIKRFDPNKIAKQYNDLYQQVIDEQ